MKQNINEVDIGASIKDTDYCFVSIDGALRRVKKSVLLAAVNGEISDLKSDFTEHESTKNPHGTTASDVGALPTDGGTLLGPVSFHIGDKSFSIAPQEDGNFIIWNGSKAFCFNVSSALTDWLFLHDNETSTNYKIYGEHNKDSMPFLPDIGGTLSGMVLQLFNGKGGLQIDSTSAHLINRKTQGDGYNYRTISLADQNISGISDSLVLNDVNDGISKAYHIYGSHNKPYGTYDGNGSTTQRTINTGGYGNVLFVWTEGTFAMVTPIGASIFKDGSSAVTYCAGDKVNFMNGILTLKTTVDGLNKSGITYVYQVL